MINHFNKELVLTKEIKIDEILRTLLHVGFVIIFMLMVMLKEEIIIVSLENIEALRKETVTSSLN